MPLETRLFAALTPWLDAPGWRVAFSGGLDSTVLLHLLVKLSQVHPLPALTALHIHHGLQEAADAWPAHCQRVCEKLGVPLQVVAVKVASGPSVERAAREARYAAFAATLASGELLLTAQHRDDQAETLLFRLLRGAGVRGLAGMPVHRPLGPGLLLRPLLDVSRVELETYAQEHGLHWIEDPSNTDSHYSRNYLRRQVIPLMTARWPQVLATLARSAAHLCEAHMLLGELAELDLAAAQGDASDHSWLPLPSLALPPLRALSAARQRNALRHWLAPLTPLPDSDHWQGWETLREAAADTAPIWSLGQGDLHRADERLWWLSGEWRQVPVLPAQGLALLMRDQSIKLPGNGWLQLSGGIDIAGLNVRYRVGGEVLQIPGRGHRDLKRLLNECAVPRFVRGRLPLLFRGDQLIGVANFPHLSSAVAQGWRLDWRGSTNDQGLS